MQQDEYMDRIDKKTIDWVIKGEDRLCKGQDRLGKGEDRLFKDEC